LKADDLEAQVFNPFCESVYQLQFAKLHGANNLLLEQGRQMVYFQTQNPNLGKFCIALQW
jgi:hypothetical protein